VEIYLETRGSARSTGYRFLGEAPGQSWWRRRYGERTAFEYPTLLVEGDEAGWRVYLGAVPSSRRDPGGSVNRVAIVLDAPAAGAVTDDDRDAAVRLVAAWMADIADEQVPGRLQQALDEQFPEETVALLYSETTRDGVIDGVRKAAASLDPPPTASVSDPGPSWIAPLRFDDARTAFLARVRRLVDGQDAGSAVIVNLIDDAESYGLAAAEPPAAVLAADPDDRLKQGFTPLPKEQAPQPTSPVAHRPRRLYRWVAVAVLAAAVVVAAIIWALPTAGREAGTATAPGTPAPSPTPAHGP
jgi:hypothetical protein